MSEIERALLEIINKQLYENGAITEDEFLRVQAEIQSSTPIDNESETLV